MTEVLALVLNIEQGIAEDLFKKWSDLDDPGPIDVATQVLTGRDGRAVDLELKFGKSTIWIEVKKDSDVSKEQLENYAQDLGKRHPANGVLVSLARANRSDTIIRELEAEDLPKHANITRLVAEDWPRLAKWLHEGYPDNSLATHLYGFLMDEGVVNAKVRREHIESFRWSDDAKNSLFELSGIVASRVEEAGANGRRWKPREGGRKPTKLGRWYEYPFCWDTYRPPDTDAGDEPFLEWNFAMNLDPDEGSPAFGAGLTRLGHPDWEGFEIPDAIRNAGFLEFEAQGHARLFKALDTSQVVDYPTVQAQAAQVSRWVETRFQELLDAGIPLPNDSE